MGFLMGHSAWQIDQFPTCWPMNGLFVHRSRGWGVSSFSERLVCQDYIHICTCVDDICKLIIDIPITHRTLTPMVSHASKLNQFTSFRTFCLWPQSASVIVPAKFCCNLTLLMLETEYPAYLVNTMPAGAVATYGAMASSGMIMTIQDKQHVSLFHCEFGLLLLNKIQDKIWNGNASLIIFNSACSESVGMKLVWHWIR